MLANTVVHALHLNVSLGSYVVGGLKHENNYDISLVLINVAGANATYTGGVSTTVGM